MNKIIEEKRINFVNTALLFFSVLSLILGIFFLVSRDYQSSANFFAAFGALVASIVTLRVARSADETAKNSLSISESMRDLEIKSESPHLRILDVCFSKNGSAQYEHVIIGIKNFGTTVAFDCFIDNKYFENDNCVLLPMVYPYNTSSGINVRENIYCKIKKECVDNKFDGDYFLTYNTMFGHKFRLDFSISKDTKHDNNYYIVNSQKLILEK